MPLVLFAHSMGSFVGQTLMGERGTAYRGVVLSGTNGPPARRRLAAAGSPTRSVLRSARAAQARGSPAP